jgi:hypothetical protein
VASHLAPSCGLSFAFGTLDMAAEGVLGDSCLAGYRWCLKVRHKDCVGGRRMVGCPWYQKALHMPVPHDVVAGSHNLEVNLCHMLVVGTGKEPDSSAGTGHRYSY